MSNKEEHPLLFDLIKTILNRILVGIAITTIVFLLMINIMPNEDYPIDFSYTNSFVYIIVILVVSILCVLLCYLYIELVHVKTELFEVKRDTQSNIFTANSSNDKNIRLIKESLSKIENETSESSKYYSLKLDDIDSKIKDINKVIIALEKYRLLKSEIERLEKLFDNLDYSDESNDMKRYKNVILYVARFIHKTNDIVDDNELNKERADYLYSRYKFIENNLQFILNHYHKRTCIISHEPYCFSEIQYEAMINRLEISFNKEKNDKVKAIILLIYKSLKEGSVKNCSVGNFNPFIVIGNNIH